MTTESTAECRRFGFAKLTGQQLAILHVVVADCVVVDFGAGDLELSRELAKSAKHLYAMDSHNSARFSSRLPTNMSFQQSLFCEYSVPTETQIAVISWPPNYDTASFQLKRLLSEIETVIYIGRNDGFITQCGTPTLWEELVQREPTCVLDNQPNAVLVYSNSPRVSGLCREEHFGLDPFADPIRAHTPKSPNSLIP